MNLYICSDLAKSRLFQHLKVLPIACFLIQSDVVESAGLYFCYIYTASPNIVLHVPLLVNYNTY